MSMQAHDGVAGHLNPAEAPLSSVAAQDGSLVLAQASMLSALKTLDRLEMHSAAALLAQAISATGVEPPLPKEP